jgi:hypothetical protein
MLRFTPPGRARYVFITGGTTEVSARASVDILASATATILLIGSATIGMSVSAEAVPASPYSAKALVTCGCTVSASVINEGSASVDVAIDTAVSGGLVRNASAAVGVEITSGCTGVSLTTQSGSASITVDITSDCTGETRIIQQGTASIDVVCTSTCTGEATQTYYGTGAITVGITADATGTSLTTHTGTADIQVNIDIAASGLTDNQIPEETVTVSSMTLHGDALLTGDAAIGTKAIAFDGSSGYGVINDTFQSTFQSPFSISMWLKPDDGQDSYQRALFRTYEPVVEDYIVYEMYVGKLKFYMTDASASSVRGYQTTSAVFSDGTQSSYTHAIVTVDSTATPIVYINGSSVALTQTHSDAISLSNYAGIGNAVISGYSEANPTYGTKFKGKIDDISLWSTQLSSTQASSLYNSGSGTDLTGSSDLVGWWKMGEGSTALPPNGTATITASITATATGTLVPAGFSISTFNTEVNILALTPANGTIAFGTDTNNYYVYDSSLGWATFTP